MRVCRICLMLIRMISIKAGSETQATFTVLRCLEAILPESKSVIKTDYLYGIVTSNNRFFRKRMHLIN